MGWEKETWCDRRRRASWVWICRGGRVQRNLRRCRDCGRRLGGRGSSERSPPCLAEQLK